MMQRLIPHDMERNVNKFRLTFFLFFFSVLIAGDAGAEPWASPGDRVLRQDVELLKAYGIISGPVTTWPITWAQITNGIADMPERAYPQHVELALSRVRSKIPSAEDYRGLHYEAEAGLTNNERVVRDFSGGAREDVDTRLSVDKHWSSAFARLALNFRDDSNGNNVNFDGSYIAKAWRNLVFYGGKNEKWWGPGFDTSLILSTNARPMTKVGISRLVPKPIDFPVLKWLGPWSFDIFAGRLENDRDDFDHPLIMGMRFSFQPTRKLEFSLSRALQLCGKGRPCGFSTWKDALIAIGNRDNTGTFDEPGNQLASVDIRYSSRIGDVAHAFYGQIMGEDEDEFLIDDVTVVLGSTFSGAAQGGKYTWKLLTEYTDTKANRSYFGRSRFGVPFNNFIFTDGFRLLDRSLAASIDADSRLITIEVSLLDDMGRNAWIRYRNVDINAANRPASNLVSRNFETMNLFEAGVEAPTIYGDFRAELRVADDQPNTPFVNDFNAAFELLWKKRF